MRRNCVQHGFTLIEVVVALTILAWVLGSVLFLVSQYADERLMMRERFYENQVAWNQLLDNYQKSRGWVFENGSAQIELEGSETQGGQNWIWQLNIEPAMGKDLFRYQTRVSSEFDPDSQSVLTIYLLNAQGVQDEAAP
tara:strand:- start:93086 stop:93502 length:417 start_codon:yes stop_codon:yes gene_type:complete